MKFWIKGLFSRDALVLWAIFACAGVFYFFLSEGDNSEARSPKKDRHRAQDTKETSSRTPHIPTSSITPRIPSRTATEKEVADSANVVKIHEVVATLKDTNLSSNPSIRKKLVEILKSNPGVAREALLQEYNSELPQNIKGIIGEVLSTSQQTLDK